MNVLLVSDEHKDTQQVEAPQRFLANDDLDRVMARARSVQRRYEALLEHATDAISLISPSGVILEVNRRWEEILQLTNDQILGRYISDFVVDGQQAEAMAIYQNVVAAGGGSPETPIPIRRADGTVVHLQFSLSRTEIDGTDLVLSIGRDVSDALRAKQLEAQMRQAQKMEAVGQLTGGVAHDFNNILAAILANCHFLIDDLGPQDPRRADALEIKKAAERAAALTRQLLAFSRRQVMETTNLNLNDVIGGLERMLRRVIGEDVDFDVVQGPNLGTVRADAGQIEQVLMNLVVNARDAMPGGGRLSIETTNVDLDAAYVQTHVSGISGRYVMIAVSDTGCGMDAETAARAFEPFFTTKERGKGTGLGLSTCYGIVKQSGGFIWLYSEPGRGTVFKLYFPRVDGPRNEHSIRTRAIPRNLHGTETILLVEDDESVRLAVARILGSLGYRVLKASNGAEAIALTQMTDQHLHLVLSDVIIPGLSGPEIVAKLGARAPKALFMSGYTDHAILRAGALQSGVNFIQKPFGPEALAAKVRMVLDA